MPPGTFYPKPDDEHPDRYEVVMDRAADVKDAKQQLEELGVPVYVPAKLERVLAIGHFAIDADAALLILAQQAVQGPVHGQN